MTEKPIIKSKDVLSDSQKNFVDCMEKILQSGGDLTPQEFGLLHELLENNNPS
jgi:hypothetical protein